MYKNPAFLYKALLVGLVILFICVSVPSSIAINHKSSIPISDGNTLYVGGSGPGNYTNIQDAIDDASNGDTVFVYAYSSPYYENILIDKSINLIGEDKDTTEISNNWEDYCVVNISSDFVNISGFTIRYDYYWSVGISIVSCNNKITDNILHGYFDGTGIELSESAKNNIIMENKFLESINGIYSKSSNNNIIENNYFTSHWNCIVLDWSEGNIIINNTLTDNGHGIILYDSSNNTLIGNKLYDDARCTTLYLLSSDNNTIKNNTIYYGNSIYLRKSNNNSIIGNIISHCWYGIRLSNASDNIILCNSFISSTDYGIYCGFYFNEIHVLNMRNANCCYLQNYDIPSIENKVLDFIHGNNIFYHNNFINNSVNAYDKCNNIWDDGYPSGGNYWDDYTGNDSDGDGIGDTAYSISGGENEDRYPLMLLWGEQRPVAHYIYNVDESPVTFDGSSSYDLDGEIISYEWDFGDGKTGAGKVVYHKYCYIGTYHVTLTITDNDGYQESISKYVEVINANILPSIEIDGPNRGRPGVEYEYEIIITDLDGDDVYIWIDWGDGAYEEWIGPYDSGDQVNISHAWADEGIFVIKAKVKDDCSESDWSEFEIEIPRTRASASYLWFLERFPLLERLLSFCLF